MKLIVWLGNPGKKYELTRHNVGFLFLDYLVDLENFSNFEDSKHKWVISAGNIQGEKVVLLKPLTYMNLSGESIASLMNYYKIPVEDIVVIYDDLDMEFGKLRVRDTGSAGGHNGIKSTITHIGTKDFDRVKVGIGRHDHMDPSDWVLSKFTNEELETLQNDIFARVHDSVLEWISK